MAHLKKDIRSFEIFKIASHRAASQLMTYSLCFLLSAMIRRRHPLTAIVVVVTLDASHNIVTHRVTLATTNATSPERAAAPGVTRCRDADVGVVVVAVERRGRRHGGRATLGQASNLKRFCGLQKVLQSVFGDLFGQIQQNL